MSIVIPAGMPVISHGAHNDPAEGTCIMEYVSILAGERFSDHPRTAYGLLGGVARSCNDAYDDGGVLLQGLAPLAVRFIGTRKAADAYNALYAGHGLGGNIAALDARLGMWAMSRVAAYIPEDVRLRVQQFAAHLDAHLDGDVAFVPPHDLFNRVDKELHDTRILYPAMGAVYRLTKAFVENDCCADHHIAGAILSAVSAVADKNGKTAIATELTALLDEFDRLTGHQLTDTVPEPAQPEPTNPEPDDTDDDKPAAIPAVQSISQMLAAFDKIVINTYATSN
jgi:hypothetical protein